MDSDTRRVKLKQYMKRKMVPEQFLQDETMVWHCIEAFETGKKIPSNSVVREPTSFSHQAKPDTRKRW